MKKTLEKNLRRNFGLERVIGMVGYKVLDADMSSRLDNMQYELGKWYEVEEGCLEPYKNGLHFCDTLEETLFHAIKTSRFFKLKQTARYERLTEWLTTYA